MELHQISLERREHTEKLRICRELRTNVRRAGKEIRVHYKRHYADYCHHIHDQHPTQNWPPFDVHYCHFHVYDTTILILVHMRIQRQFVLPVLCNYSY